jgi:hypothetical protein
MKKEVGLWIDHSKTVMVTIKDETEVVREVRSNMEKNLRFKSGKDAKTPNTSTRSTAEDMRDRRFGNHLGNYYEGVVSLIRDADSIWIFGPGEAKVELENCLKRDDLGDRIVGVETVDRMTDNQIAAKVRDRFLR